MTRRGIWPACAGVTRVPGAGSAGTSPSASGLEAEPAVPSAGVMDEARFWAVIEASRAGGAGMEGQASELERILAVGTPHSAPPMDAGRLVRALLLSADTV